jgi:hypothetical protein
MGDFEKSVSSTVDILTDILYKSSPYYCTDAKERKQFTF